MKNSNIEFKKKFNLLKNKTLSLIKPNKCILCNSSITSCCNSHSVPRMILNNIAIDGHILQFASCIKQYKIFDLKKGINNSGTFYLLCNNCDKKYFSNYENEEELKKNPTNLIMAQIALKNLLLQLYKKNLEYGLFSEDYNFNIKKLFTIDKKHHLFNNFSDEISKVDKLDINELVNDIILYKNKLDSNKFKKNEFKILCHYLLPYKVELATQSVIAIAHDHNDNLINNLYDKSPNYRIQQCHICVFPLKTNTLLLAFYHKKDSKYDNLRNIFNKNSLTSNLEIINWLIFRYTENIFFSPLLEKKISIDENLSTLCSEIGDGVPNFGLGAEIYKYKKIKPKDVTNFLIDNSNWNRGPKVELIIP